MRVGMNRHTGGRITGWDHCVQCIEVILLTRIGWRVMRRHFGSLVPELQDRNATAMTIMQTYAAIAEALRRWEPGFRLQTIQLTRGGADGVFVFEMSGMFFPRGHLGDYSVSEAKSLALGANDNNSGVRVVAA